MVQRHGAVPSIKRATSNARHTTFARRCLTHSTAAYLGTLAALIALSRCTLLAPIVRTHHIRSDGAPYAAYRTHTALSICAACTCLALSAAAPLLIRTHASVYGIADAAMDTRFQHIALVSLCSDYAVSLLVLAAQTWRRCGVVRCLNAFGAVVGAVQRLEWHFIDWRYTLLLWLRIVHFVYGASMNLPFLARHGGELSAGDLLACLATLVVEQLSRIVALNVVAALLLLTACYAQVQRCLEQHATSLAVHTQLGGLVAALQALLQQFVGTFECSIFLLLIGEFVNLLANLYGLVYHSVYTSSVYPNLIVYNLSLAVNLYALVFCAHLCNQQRERLRHAYHTLPAATSDWAYLSQSSRSPLHVHANWPRNVPLRILGLFELDHNFWLFLVSYAVNFIVIILQFAIEELRHKQRN